MAEQKHTAAGLLRLVRQYGGATPVDDARSWELLERIRAYATTMEGGCGSSDLGEPVTWAIYDSLGFYDSRDSEQQAAEFCEKYNQRTLDPLKPYTYGPLYAPRAGGAPTPSQTATPPNTPRVRPAGYVSDLRDGATFALEDPNDVAIAVFSRPQLQAAVQAAITRNASKQAEPTEEQVSAALRAACLHDTSESRKDMRKALIAAAGAAPSQEATR